MKRSILFAVLVSGLLAGCAGSAQMRSEVTRFHQLPATGGPVAVVAVDERKSGGIEFSGYAQAVASRLAAAGFPAASGADPDYIAQLDYWQQPVAGGDDYDNGPRMSIGIGGASFGRRSGVGMGVGTSFDLGDRDRGQMAMRTVTLVIQRRADGTRVFEGRAQSMGPAANFPNAIPYMIDAIFDRFPGDSGRTAIVGAPVRR